METKTKTITIFYSWQSDNDPECNLKGIRNAIRLAIIDIEAEFENVKIDIDEATRSTPGSPDIPATIFQKISVSDIFICDITTINNGFDELPRKTSNPNVLIELGYAVASVGWDRTIMLFNKNFGKFPDDLPFDIDRRRISDYSISSKVDNNGKGKLKALIKTAVKTIIEKKPLKPFEIENLTPEEKKRRLDIANLNNILSTIHIPTLDLFLNRAPAIIPNEILHFWEGYNGVRQSGLFHLYDKEAQNLIDVVHKCWGESLSFGHLYRNSGDNNNYLFGSRSFMTEREKEEEEGFQKILKMVKTLERRTATLFQYIRDNYIEIDLNETSKRAYQEYVSFYAETMERNIESTN